MRNPGQEHSNTRATVLLKGALYLVLALAAVGMPIVVWLLDPSWLGNTYGKGYAVFELFGLTGTLALIAVAGLELRGRSGRPWENLLPVILPLLVSLNILVLVTEYSRKKAWDYECYELSARAVQEGTNPYERSHHLYLYPPLTAEVMAQAHRVVEHALVLSGRTPSAEFVWWLVFYLYQCGQVLLVMLAYFLCYVFAREAGLQVTWAHVLVAVLLLFNNPVFRTLRHDQVNFFLLDMALLGILLARRASFVGGLAIALAGHIKLYPLILLLPLGVSRCWRAVLWTVASVAGIVFIQTGFGRDWSRWEQFLDFFQHVPRKTAFRSNSLHSFFFNSFRLIGGGEPAEYQSAVKVLVLLLSLVAAGWFLLRLITRERRHGAEVRSSADGVGNTRMEVHRLYGHAVDALALALLVSPTVWEHHYVLALPLVLWAAAKRGRDRPWPVGIGAFLMLAVPTFDLFPLSYHRIVGLVLLLILTSPGKLAVSARGRSSRRSRRKTGH